MRRLVFAANWKMHKTRAEARSFMEAFRALPRTGEEGDVAVFAPATLLATLEETAGDIPFGAQNAHFEAKGAFTGELSMDHVKDAGCRYVLIGHSERRGMFGETDEGCRKKVEAALARDLIPMVCVGETLDERESHGHMAKVARQVRAVSEGLGEADAARLQVAYEPIWAIGTGKVATEAQAQEMCGHVRKTLRETVGSVSDRIPVLYGGSVKPGNIAGLIAEEDVDGALIGGASLEAASFHEIIVNGGAARG